MLIKKGKKRNAPVDSWDSFDFQTENLENEKLQLSFPMCHSFCYQVRIILKDPTRIKR